MTRIPLIALVMTFAVCARAAPSEQERLPPDAQAGNYVGSDVMIPMRDGVKLHAEIWRPRGDTSKLPILMQRSPYGFGLSKVKRSMEAEFKELAQEGFIFVLEDIRGRFVSVQASPEDMFIGDDFHHNGAFRLQYAWEYAAALETDGRTLNAFDFKKEDPYPSAILVDIAAAAKHTN